MGGATSVGQGGPGPISTPGGRERVPNWDTGSKKRTNPNAAEPERKRETHTQTHITTQHTALCSKVEKNTKRDSIVFLTASAVS